MRAVSVAGTIANSVPSKDGVERIQWFWPVFLCPFGSCGVLTEVVPRNVLHFGYLFDMFNVNAYD